MEAFDEEPVPIAVADRAYQRLLNLLASLDQSASAEGRLTELNRVAGVDLLMPDIQCNRLSLRALSRSWWLFLLTLQSGRHRIDD
jgi:hypothetical protein